MAYAPSGKDIKVSYSFNFWVILFTSIELFHADIGLLLYFILAKLDHIYFEIA